MANTTILVGSHMAIDFTLREETVMAGLAIIHYTNVRKGSRDETGSQVAHAAIIIGRHMGTVFASGDHAIVTRGTTTDDTGMIILGTGKGGGIVTYRTIFRSRQMIIGLDGRGCHTAIMTR